MRPRFSSKYKGINCRVYLVCEKGPHKQITLNSPDAVYELVKDELASSDREKILSVLLTTKNTLIGVETIGIGTLSCTVTSPREVFKSAVLANADSIILCHNHPSGNLQPSDADNKITKKIMESAKIMDIQLLDHLIIADNSYFSYADNGLM